MDDTSKTQPIPFPFGGIDYFDAYSDGNPLGDGSTLPVTQNCLNVRGVDMTTSRRRGSGRSGTNKYNPFPVSGQPIQELAAFISSRPDPSVSSGQLLMNGIDVNTGDRGFDLFSPSLQSYKVDRSLPSTIQLFCNCWDTTSPAGHFYQSGTDTSTNQFFLQRVTSSGQVLWQIHFGTSTGTPFIPLGICIAFTSAIAVAVHSSNGFYEVWYFNTSDGSRAGLVNPILSSNPSPPSGTGACGTIAQTYNSISFVGNITTSRLAICESGGLRLVNFATLATVTTITPATSGFGTGTLVSSWRVISDNNIVFYWCLQLNNSGIFNYVFSIPISGTGANTITHVVGISSVLGNGADVAYNHAPADDPGTPVVWVVFSTTSGATKGLYRRDATLGSVASQDNPFGNTFTATMLQPTPAGGLILLAITASNPNIVVAQAMAAGTPLAQESQLNVVWQDNTDNYPFLGSFPSIYASVNFSNSSANPAAFYNAYTYLAVAGGNVYEFTTDAYYQVAGGTGLSTTAPVIFSAQQGNSLYFADGVSALAYDGLADTVGAWTASAGSLPVDDNSNTPRLICLWRNRIVLAGLPNDASNWFMSAVGDATNFDYAPAGGPFQTQAVAGNNSIAGEVGDVINALIPFNDDKLIFGGNHSIWQMTGDPMAGGQLDLISNITGMPFGKPWCIDPSQNIYFIGSRGGVFRMVPGSQPVRISTRTIDAALEYLDYTKIIVRMAWDDLEQGLHLYLSPSTPGTGVVHFWYDSRNQSWWPDQFGNSLYNPLAICVLEGNVPLDRVILLGGMDGRIRKYDQTVFTDDGTSIANNALLGPFYNVYLTEIQLTLSTTSSPVTVQVQVGQDAPTAIAAAFKWSGTFSIPGRNRSQNPMIYGNVMYINIMGTGNMIIEQIIARMKPGTQNRQRIF